MSEFYRWQSHRAPDRFLRHTLTLLKSGVVSRLSGVLLFVTAWSSAFCLLHTLRRYHILPFPIPSLVIDTIAPFTLTSFALSLLLVFRTNASYARWQEARSLWGKIVSIARDITRQVLVLFPPETNSQLCPLVQRWSVAFARTLKAHLRQSGDPAIELASILQPHELEALLAAKHRPLYSLQVLSTALSRSGCHPSLSTVIDRNISLLADTVGCCERILRTPIPLSYTRHTVRSIILWLILLPTSLYPVCGWAVVPICTCIAFLLLGIEDIGVSIEEPFSFLPLEALCDTIEKDTQELLQTHGNDLHHAKGVAAETLITNALARRI